MDDPRFAMLLASRICHDLISPVGAVNNGLEILDDVTTPDMRDDALNLIRGSAKSASSKLQFMRMAFGAGGSMTESVSLEEAEKLSDGLTDGTPVQLDWQAATVSLDRQVVKLLLNMILIGFEALPRGGTLSVGVRREGATNLMVAAEGQKLKLPEASLNILQNGAQPDEIDAKQSNLLLTHILSTSLDASMMINHGSERLEIASTF